jgi:hypothetical protein
MDKKTTKSQSIHRQGIKISTIKSNQKTFFSRKKKGKILWIHMRGNVTCV